MFLVWLSHRIKFFITVSCLTLFCLTTQASAKSIENISHSEAILNINPNTIDAAAWILFDPQSDQVLASHNEQVQRAPASITKLMVAYITLSKIKSGQLELDTLLTVPKEVEEIASDESQLGLKPNQKVSVDFLLKSALIMSANDAAITLGHHISGSTEKFVAEMNKTAKQLEMYNTRFMNPSGITHADHYSTALDLALLSRAMLEDVPEFLSYSAMPVFKYKEQIHKSTNWLLDRDPSVDGLKTGYTRAAGYNFAATAARSVQPNMPKRRLIAIVLGSNSKAARADIAQKLLNAGFVYTQNQLLVKKGASVASMTLWNSLYLNYNLRLPKPLVVSMPIQPNQQPISFAQIPSDPLATAESLNLIDAKSIAKQNYPYQFDFKQQHLYVPIVNKQVIGEIKVLNHDNDVIKTMPLLINQDILTSSAWTKFSSYVRYLWTSWTGSDTKPKILISDSSLKPINASI